MTHDGKDSCEHCPAWSRLLDPVTGGDILSPILDGAGQPVVKDGARQYQTAPDGRPLTAGSCRLFAPRIVKDGMAGAFPTVRSDWWCADPHRIELQKRTARAKRDR